MTSASKCDSCKIYKFDLCGKHFPCPKLMSRVPIKGIAFKANSRSDIFTKNVEAKFIPNDNTDNENFLSTSYSIAKKTKILPVTTFEFNVLTRNLKGKEGRACFLEDSDSEFILTTENWAAEIRSVLKYLLRIYTLDLAMPFNYINKVASQVNPAKPLEIDRGNLSNIYFYYVTKSIYWKQSFENDERIFDYLKIIGV